MHQLKIFKFIEPHLTAAEKQINDWLAEENVRVVHLMGNIAPQSGVADPKSGYLTKSPHDPSDIMIVIVYEKP